jgi:hypothetical protein
MNSFLLGAWLSSILFICYDIYIGTGVNIYFMFYGIAMFVWWVISAVRNNSKPNVKVRGRPLLGDPASPPGWAALNNGEKHENL